VLIPVRDLVRRWRGPRSRAVEVDAVRARMRRARDEPASDEVRALAAELRELRPLVLAAFDRVESCTGCAKGHSLPHGRWDGGFCCGGRTDGVFDDDEVAALALAGTDPRDLRPPGGDHAGCAFRGPQGCSLDARDRPNLCVRFACRELEAELRARGEWDRVRALTRRLETTFARFRETRRADPRCPTPSSSTPTT
jgi:hypothetical protein